MRRFAMIARVFKSILLLGLVALYAYNLIHSDNIVQSLLFDKLNFVVLLGILLLLGTFVKLMNTVFTFVLIGGLAFYGYTYYQETHNVTTNAAQGSARQDDCGENASWYRKLSAHCNNPVK